jgi:hypothetical protein
LEKYVKEEGSELIRGIGQHEHELGTGNKFATDFTLTSGGGDLVAADFD